MDLKEGLLHKENLTEKPAQECIVYEGEVMWSPAVEALSKLLSISCLNST